MDLWEMVRSGKIWGTVLVGLADSLDMRNDGKNGVLSDLALEK